MNKDHLKQPFSAGAYAVMALVAGLIGVGLLVFYVRQVPKLTEPTTRNQVFYVVLIPSAIACAVALFGAMRSYARFTYKHVGSFLELGGPVVLFCLVVVGGFKLVPSPPESFDLTVRAHGADGKEPIIKSGQVTVDFDIDRRTEPFGANGEANFKGIPARFSGVTLRFLPQVPNYEETPQLIKLAGHVVDLPLERAHPKTVLRGSIVLPLPRKGSDINILVESGQGEPVHPDKFGRFELTVEGKDGDSVRLKVFADGKSLYDDYQTLPGPVTIQLHKPR